MQKVLAETESLSSKSWFLDNRMSTIGNNGQNIACKQQNVEDAESESLEEIFPFRTQKDLYSFDKKLANKTCSREVVNIFYFMFMLTIEVIYYYYI